MAVQLRIYFSEQLELLQNNVVLLMDSVEKAWRQALDALARRDVLLAQQVIVGDTVIDRLRYQIEEQCVSLMALQAPVSTDLRRVVAMLTMAGDLERMGDYAEGIARLICKDLAESPLRPDPEIFSMADSALTMLNRARMAYVTRNPTFADVVAADDNLIDAQYEAIAGRLMEALRLRSAADSPYIVHMLFVAHNIERAADRVTNLCERITFIYSGRMVAGLAAIEN